MRALDSKTIIVVLLLLFLAGSIFSSYVIYSSFNLANEEPKNFGKISFSILPRPETPPEATGRSTIAFKIIERPEE